jgi:hypothetical protein
MVKNKMVTLKINHQSNAAKHFLEFARTLSFVTIEEDAIKRAPHEVFLCEESEDFLANTIPVDIVFDRMETNVIQYFRDENNKNKHFS